MCDVECDGPRGCIEGKSEQGRFRRITDAKQECLMCPEREACADWAIDTGQEFGVWGGMTERERRKAKRERKQHRGY